MKANLKQKTRCEQVWTVFLLTFLMAIVLDQGTKFASILLQLPASRNETYFDFYFSGFPLLALVFVLSIFLFSLRRLRRDWLFYSLFLAGSFANLIDWFRWGYVLDILPFFGFFWFNLADFFIILAVAILAMRLFLKTTV